MARFSAARLGPALGKPVPAESRSGASGTLRAEFVADAPADGHGLGISDVAPHALPLRSIRRCATSCCGT